MLLDIKVQIRNSKQAVHKPDALKCALTRSNILGRFQETNAVLQMSDREQKFQNPVVTVIREPLSRV
jgi:hypothetical protein